MKFVIPKPAALGLALTLFLSNGIVTAQTPAPKPASRADAAAQAELAVAQRDLERAAKRVAELSRQLGRDDDNIRRVERRVIRKPVIGVLLGPDTQTGVRIVGVTPDSAAAKAGLKSGDRVVSINGQQVLGSRSELRVENARKLLGNLDTKTQVKLVAVRDGRNTAFTVTPRLGERIIAMSGMPADVKIKRDMRMREFDDGTFDIEADEMKFGPPAQDVAQEVQRELRRIAPRGDCKGEHCRTPMLMEAFRWNGLNLASVDAQLGRYFGTNSGVLVLSTGPDLAGLQAGDVIHKVDGKTVNSPREAMAALRGKPAESLVAVDYLRDRKAASAKLKVPKALPLRIPVPPTPPAPPMAPRAPVPPPPPPGTAFEHEVIMRGEVPMMAFAPEAPLPPDAPEIVEEIEIETR